MKINLKIDLKNVRTLILEKSNIIITFSKNDNNEEKIQVVNSVNNTNINKKKREVVDSVNNNIDRALIIDFSTCGKSYLMNRIFFQNQSPSCTITK